PQVDPATEFANQQVVDAVAEISLHLGEIDAAMLGMFLAEARQREFADGIGQPNLHATAKPAGQTAACRRSLNEVVNGVVETLFRLGQRQALGRSRCPTTALAMCLFRRDAQQSAKDQPYRRTPKLVLMQTVKHGHDYG